MSPWKNRLVLLTLTLLGISFPAFFVTGYTALYSAWIRGNLHAALPFLPWARNFGMLAMVSAAVSLTILFSSKTFPIQPKIRFGLSLLAVLTIGFFAEFRNEGKFHFKVLVHFFGPGTWIHDGLNRIASSSGDFLYRIEYSHWNDFLMGPAIVSILFALVFVKIYGAFRNQGSISLSGPATTDTTDLDQTLRFARILMNVGLFWFFIQAWGEKAGYLRNPHSIDEIDLPFEFVGTMLGFWMARVLTKPFDGRPEKFRSTFAIDFVASGVIGLLYTLIVGPLTEAVASSVAHSLYSVVPSSLEAHEYTRLQQHMRPLELLLLAAAMWWGLSRSSQDEGLTLLSNSVEPSATVEEGPEQLESIEPPTQTHQWAGFITMFKTLIVTTGYLLILAAMLSLLQPEGLGWTLAAITAALGAGSMAVVIVRRAALKGVTTVFGDRKN